ncbi:hypothetical protein [Sinanaerobacter chloroacetimidivorans]|uniref:Zinc-finger domain-containing protein n=1 Tax=Sinanaerobacter chloroacetimidivorans TaxID=2818044 RepID=A0A8J7W3C1_9FIRM|nr:hypothetical protein [Sinanaerobacter chloroacetimidivorans]MBR0598160.1 hypothetical protein [Sinanaerobacter chloroacetimidivorans]
MKCEMKEYVLEYLKGDSHDLEIEKHLEHCEQCQALMEGYLAKEDAINLPEAECITGNLKERVENYDKGTKRIVVFTIVGLILGWFSYKYYITDFLPLKIVIGIPYKISEMIHVTFHDHSFIYLTQYTLGQLNEFFPQAHFASFFAEYGISSLIGGAIYGSLGFFTGDKRIFTLTKYLKFAAVWAIIISLAVGGTFLANHAAVEKNQKFEDVSGFFLNYESGGEGFYDDDTGEREDFFKALEEAFYADGQITETNRQRNAVNEELIEFVFGPWYTRYMAALINLQEGYLVSDTGRVYSMSDEFCQMVIVWQKKEEEKNARIAD